MYGYPVSIADCISVVDSPDKLIPQGCGYANLMSGQHSGVQALQVCMLYAYQLNLIIAWTS